MNSVLSVLDETGDFEIRWNADDPQSIEQARKAITDLKDAGYSFFVINGGPADEIAAAGAGCALNVRRADMSELIPEAVREGTEDASATELAPAKRRGRPAAQPKPIEAIAVRPMRGG